MKMLSVDNCVELLRSNAIHTNQLCYELLAKKFNVYANNNVYAGLKHDDDDDDEGCGPLDGLYSNWLHIAAVFIILVASAIGTVIPIIGKRVPMLRMHDYVYAVGKCIGTGVMMAVGMIHMINEAVHGFEASCAPEHFKDMYEAWAFCLAMIAAILMHAIDIEIAEVVDRWMNPSDSEESMSNNHCNDINAKCDKVIEPISPEQKGMLRCPLEEKSDINSTIVNNNNNNQENQAEMATVEMLDEDGMVHNPMTVHCHCTREVQQDNDNAQMLDNYECHGHSHVLPSRDDVPLAQRVVAAVCMEFGVTLHSVFVGLSLGVTEDKEAKTLIIALVFHQMFEGLATGARLADAEFHISVEMIMAMIFSFSAPVGIAIGTGVVSASKSALSGTNYVMVQAVFNSICGGILVYLAFSLMLIDFPHDIRRHCSRGQRYHVIKRIGLFAGLWIGAGVMALIGKWL